MINDLQHGSAGKDPECAPWRAVNSAPRSPRSGRKAFCLVIERTEVGVPGQFGSLADDGLERAVVERFAPLAFSHTQH
jgi:hypothetical protein